MGKEDRQVPRKSPSKGFGILREGSSEEITLELRPKYCFEINLHYRGRREPFAREIKQLSAKALTGRNTMHPRAHQMDSVGEAPRVREA